MGGKVLVLDDMSLNRRFIKGFLVSKGFEVETAEDGMAGMEMARTGAYDLIFSDIEMPNMNGLEFLKRVKELAAYKAVPVIMLTTLDRPEIIDRAKRLGASFYIVKPFTEQKMAEALGHVGL